MIENHTNSAGPLKARGCPPWQLATSAVRLVRHCFACRREAVPRDLPQHGADARHVQRRRLAAGVHGLRLPLQHEAAQHRHHARAVARGRRRGPGRALLHRPLQVSEHGVPRGRSTIGGSSRINRFFRKFFKLPIVFYSTDMF